MQWKGNSPRPRDVLLNKINKQMGEDPAIKANYQSDPGTATAQTLETRPDKRAPMLGNCVARSEWGDERRMGDARMTRGINGMIHLYLI